MKKLAITLCKVFLLIALVSIPLTAQADIITDFEADTVGLAPVASVTSTTGKVTVATNDGFTPDTASDYPPAPASFGDNFAYLTTGPEENGGGQSDIDRTGDGENEFDIATMEITFSASGPSMLKFFFNILTSEINYENDVQVVDVPDPIEITLDGVTLFSGAIMEANGSFPAITGWFDNSITGPDGSYFEFIKPFSHISPVSSGTHILEFFVGDESDDEVDTALVVDNITLETQPVPEPATMLLLGTGLVGLAGLRRKFRKR